MQRVQTCHSTARCCRAFLTGFLCLALQRSDTIGAEIVPARDAGGQPPSMTVAVQEVCAWPNLTLLRDGSIIATIHNQPSHLSQPADVDCWATSDGGKTWQKRGTPAPRETPQVARGNVAAGIDRDGSLIVIASGWSDPAATNHGKVLPPVVSRSGDGGKTWEIHHDSFPEEWPSQGRRAKSPEGYLIPFGDILTGHDGALHVCMYGGSVGATRIYRSEDSGRTWKSGEQVDSSEVVLEPAFLHLGNGHWLLASRFKGLTLYTSQDDGRTWMRGESVSDPNAHPGHLLLLRDGHVLLTYGNRNIPRGIDARISLDQGKTWSPPRRVTGFEGDGGYPACVELPDGQILTAYYASLQRGKKGYHMGTVTWSPSKSWETE